MKVLVTGASGFIGKNLCIRLSNISNLELITFSRKNNIQELSSKVNKADFIIHLAGINRPKREREFFDGNTDLTKILCDIVSHNNRKIPIIFTSSIQAEFSNAYGKSKLQAEQHLLNLNAQYNNPVYIYRLPNIFGKWCKPSYNSVVATFCHNINRDIPIEINDPDKALELVHIDNLVDSFIKTINNPSEKSYIAIEPTYQITVGKLAKKLLKFKHNRTKAFINNVGEGFMRLLYSTYISYLPTESFNYQLTEHSDERGKFAEVLKIKKSGQFSFFTAYPGVTRGGHYHHIKTEKFLVVNGQACFKFKNMITNQSHEIVTCGEKLEIVETIPGWSHNITNIGENKMIVLLWANETFDPNKPDTIYSDI